MPGLLERSIDRELGPVAGGSAPRSARDSWLRDWPLLLGLVLSASLIVASAIAGHSQARPDVSAIGSRSAGAGAMPGDVVDVGNGDAKPPKKAVHKRRLDKAASTGAAKQPHVESTSKQAEPAAAAATDQPAATHTPTQQSSGGGADSGSGSSGGAVTPGKIVNVTGTSVAFANGPVAYQFDAPTHTPTVGKHWRLQIAVKRSGAPLAGTVKIDILHNGSIVGHAATGKLASGRFTHDFGWPKESAGYPLTVKTTVVGGGFQQSFLFNVKVRAAG
jgi:hypothetical protein